MASTYAVNTGIELIADGEQSGTWGDTTNTNLQIVDRLTSGVRFNCTFWNHAYIVYFRRCIV